MATVETDGGWQVVPGEYAWGRADRYDSVPLIEGVQTYEKDILAGAPGTMLYLAVLEEVVVGIFVAEVVVKLRDAWKIDWVFKNVLDWLEPKSLDARWCVRWARVKAYEAALDGSMKSDVIAKSVAVIVRAIDSEKVPNIKILVGELLAVAAGVADDGLVKDTIR